MGGFEALALAGVEPLVKYHPYCTRTLTPDFVGETVPVGQFDWGGYLLKRNGGVQRYPQCGRQSHGECKGTRVLDCETYKSSRVETRT